MFASTLKVFWSPFEYICDRYKKYATFISRIWGNKHPSAFIQNFGLVGKYKSQKLLIIKKNMAINRQSRPF